jgi:excisionase family DNA binding protein
VTATEPAEAMVLDIPEVGRRLGGLSRGTVQAMISSGELRSIKIRDRRFVTVEALRAYVAERVAAAS